ncbi:hypothetical protein MNBD_GAMMA12-3828 [hydrothermal vent metagenome]|uniref:Uncharacterized protein n=1 Tax=hydrothermal vent metagenome TaxID=652676 RepID=A0A3B0YJZ0_9ZZZZ
MDLGGGRKVAPPVMIEKGLSEARNSLLLDAALTAIGIGVARKYGKTERSSTSFIDELPANSGWTRPKGWRLPKNGRWEGNPGDSAFIPNDAKSLGLTVGQKIQFRRGYPDFNPFVQERFKVNGLSGKHVEDMPLIQAEIALQKGFIKADRTPNVAAAKFWLVKNKLTPHHDPFTNTVITLPGALHGIPGHFPQGVRHMGGAFRIRNE